MDELIQSINNVLKLEIATFASLDMALISEILRWLEPDALRQMRLVNHRLKKAVDENIISLDPTPGGWFHYFRGSAMVIKYTDKRWPKVRKLKLCFSTIHDPPPTVEHSQTDWCMFYLCLAKWSIEELSVSGSDIGIHGAFSIGKAVKSNWHKLTVLDLSKNRLDDVAVSVLFQVKNPSLEKLNLGANKIGGNEGTDFSLALMAKNCPNLQHLNLSLNRLESRDLKSLVKLGDLAYLKHFDLSGNNLDSGSGKILAKGAPRWPSLFFFDITGNFLGDQGVDDFLQGHWKFETFTLYNGLLGINAAISLSRATFRSTLKTLNINFGFKWETLEIILQEEWSNLEELRLSEDIWGPDLGAILAAANGQLPRLKMLCLHDLGPEGFENLMDAFWPKLESLRVFGLRLAPGSRGTQALANANEHGKLPSLKTLELWCSSLALMDIEALFSSTWLN